MKIADMHCDTISGLYQKRKAGSREGLAENGGHVDLRKLEAGDSLVQNFALYVDLGKTENPWEDVLGMADLYYEELEANRGRIAPVSCYGDIEKNRKEGKISALLTVEEGGRLRREGGTPGVFVSAGGADDDADMELSE